MTLVAAGCTTLKSYKVSLEVQDLERKVSKIEYFAKNKSLNFDDSLELQKDRSEVLVELWDNLPRETKLKMARKLLENPTKEVTDTAYNKLDNLVSGLFRR